MADFEDKENNTNKEKQMGVRFSKLPSTTNKLKLDQANKERRKSSVIIVNNKNNLNSTKNKDVKTRLEEGKQKRMSVAMNLFKSDENKKKLKLSETELEDEASKKRF